MKIQEGLWVEKQGFNGRETGKDIIMVECDQSYVCIWYCERMNNFKNIF